jgi:hypothetical protein
MSVGRVVCPSKSIEIRFHIYLVFNWVCDVLKFEHLLSDFLQRESHT